jgi:glycerol-3-phosphate dehydrogenase
MPDFDLAIIGGGINGAGIARDAAGRGLRVLLIEQSDLAAGTSSASSKLIHGGLRYLEHGALRLVHAALGEREVLLKMAPHLIRPLRFVLPLDSRYRSPAMLRLGLFLYDMIGHRAILPGTRSVDLTIDATGVPLRRHFHRGFEYSDCFADDARLVVLNAIDATWRLVLNARGTREVVTARSHQCGGRLGRHGRRNGLARKAVRPAAAR